MEELSSLPYLDAVVRETLRIHAPVPSTMRVAQKDDVIPVGEPFVDRHGNVQDSIRISKGSPILIPILALNRSTKLWGEDALEFRCVSVGCRASSQLTLPRIIDPSVGLTLRRRFRAFLGCGATCCRSSVARVRVLDTASRSSSTSHLFMLFSVDNV